MPVDKMDYDEVRHFGQTFTTVVNEVTAGMSANAVAAYVYLMSKPRDWIIRPRDVRNRYGWGRHTWMKVAKELRDAGVMFDRIDRDEKGRVVKRVLYIGSQSIESMSSKNGHTESISPIIGQSDERTVGKSDPLVIKDLLQSKETIQKDFESFWSSTTSEFGAKGSKTKCLAQFKKLEQSVRNDLKEIYQDQLSEKRAAKSAGEFCPNFPHLERWIRDGRYEDESSAPQEDGVWGLVQ